MLPAPRWLRPHHRRLTIKTTDERRPPDHLTGDGEFVEKEIGGCEAILSALPPSPHNREPGNESLGWWSFWRIRSAKGLADLR